MSLLTMGLGFAVDSHVTRDGSDIHVVKSLAEDGLSGEFVCIVAPLSKWCEVGDKEFNLCRRYIKINEIVLNEADVY